MSESLAPTSRIYEDFELSPTVPEALGLIEGNLLGTRTIDALSVYVVRAAGAEVDLGSDPTSLFNGKLGHDGALPWIQASEGNGMYASTTLRGAKSTPFIKGDNLYLLKVQLEDPRQILDANHADANSDLTATQIAAARWLRWRGRLPGIPGPGGLPGPKRGSKFDEMYGGDKELIVFPPMAAARPFTGLRQKVGDLQIPTNWAIIRNPQNTTEIVGRRLAAKRTNS